MFFTARGASTPIPHVVLAYTPIPYSRHRPFDFATDAPAELLTLGRDLDHLDGVSLRGDE